MANDTGKQPSSSPPESETRREERLAILNLLEDLDEDRRRLTQAEEEWRAAFDSVRDAIFTHDEECRIVRANRAYLELAGCAAEQAEGRPYWEIFPRSIEARSQCATDEHGRETEFDVGERVFRNRAYRMRRDAGRVGVAIHIIEEITERRLAERELQLRSQELSGANTALRRSLDELRTMQLGLVRSERLATIGTLASGIAHELNNPLMGLMNYVAYAREKSCDRGAAEALEKAQLELERMEGFARNLLFLGRQTGEEPVPVRIMPVVARALDLVAADLRKRGVQVEVRLADLPPVAAVPGRLQQVFLNLFINAADAMAETPEKRLTISGEADAEWARVVVADTGTGVAKEQEGNLFEPFFTTKPEGQGTGLGLSVSQRIMQGFGGSLEYLSGGRGARFLLRLRRLPE